jgi:uncharacterized protein YuzE
MYITYDARVDAVYIKLNLGHAQVETKVIDEDINLDFDEHGRLVGVEVLSASERLDLAALLPIGVKSHVTNSDSDVFDKDAAWERLRTELQRRMDSGEPIQTGKRGVCNWIKEIREDRVVLQSDDPKSKGPRPIKRKDIEQYDPTVGRIGKGATIRALRRLGGYPTPPEEEFKSGKWTHDRH